MKSIPIAALRADQRNVRQLAASKDDDAGLAASIRELGVLQPIVVTESVSGGYQIVFGHRRVAAAQAAGLTEIPAEIIEVAEDKIAAMQAAENMVRAGMSELDEWRAMKRLQADGLSLQQAAAAIGVKERDAKRLDLLGSMHPDVLALMESDGLPDRLDVLAIIANAPPSVQAIAIKTKGAVTGKGKNRHVDWWKIKGACEVKRISAEVAIFDWRKEQAAGTGPMFDDDLFANEGDKDQHTTSDIAGFIAAQERAVQAMVDGMTAKGRAAMLVKLNDQGEPVIPAGWRRGWNLWQDDPKAWPNLKPSDGKTVAIGVKRAGYGVGGIHACVLEKVEAPGAKGKAARDPDAPPPAPKPVISKDGLDMIATIKGDVLRAHLNDHAYRLGAQPMLAALLVALCASNVRIVGAGGTEYSVTSLADIAAKLVSADGRLDWPEDLLPGLAAQAIGRIIGFDSPKARGRSGPVAELIAGAFAVPLPRFDTAEFLQHVAGAKLRELAAGAGIRGVSKVSDLRAALVGKLPDWRPAAADFVADWRPAPHPLDHAALGDDEQPDDDAGDAQDGEQEAA